MFLTLSYLLLSVSLIGVMLVFAFYPFILFLSSLFKHEYDNHQDIKEYYISLIVVVRNAEDLIKDKIENCLSLHYPSKKLEVIFYSDGSTDNTNQIIHSYKDKGIKFFHSTEHRGKIDAINAAVKQCSGEILVLTDADALLEAEALNNMMRHYIHPSMGGVCGQRVISNDRSTTVSSQEKYIKLDTAVKILESKLRRITSNDGKIYSLRRRLFKPIETGVTDDLFTCLTVIRQGYSFVFEPEARAFIKVPSRTPAHEIQRRQRIVAQSLRGIFILKDLLNPFRYGFFSLGLFINKVLRRVLPVFLLLIFFSTLYLSFSSIWLALFLFIQSVFYALSLVHLSVNKLALQHASLKKMNKGLELIFYFCIGNAGTLLGFITFLSGKKIKKWDPVKSD